MYWGGEPGANRINKYLYPGTFEIYSDISAKLLLKTDFAVPKEEDEIKIYRKFWLDNQENNIVPALLIYADLMGSGNSRCLEVESSYFGIVSREDFFGLFSYQFRSSNSFPYFFPFCRCQLEGIKESAYLNTLIF
jgi:hypothetical protein